MTALFSQSPYMPTYNSHSSEELNPKGTNIYTIAADARLPLTNGLFSAYVCKKMIQVSNKSDEISVIFCISFFNQEDINSKKPGKLKKLVDSGRIVCVSVKENKIDAIFFSQTQAEIMRSNNMTDLGIKCKNEVSIFPEQPKSKTFTERNYNNYTAKLLKDFVRV